MAGDQTASETIRQKLQEELDRIDAQLGSIAAATLPSDTAPRPGYGKRVGDYTAEALDAQRNELVAKRLRISQRDASRAMEKLDEGTYGVCDHCGNAIDPERLEALPWATLCIECKRASESKR